MADWVQPDLPDAKTFGVVTYCVPQWASEDRMQRQHTTVRVSFPGKLTWPEGNPWGMYNAPPHDGTEYAPLDSFCDVEAGEGETAMAYAIPVHTFGTLIEKLVADGQRVRVGEPLFLYEARPPTTCEWMERYEEAGTARRKFHELWFVLKGSPVQILRWKHRYRRKVPRDFELGARRAEPPPQKSP